MDKTVIRLTGAAIVAALALAITLMGETSRIAIGGIIGVLSFVLMNISRYQLGKSFSIMPQAKALVTTGVYSKILHPMYVFLDLFLIGLIIVLDVPMLFFVWGIIVVVQTLQSRREERVLASAFGADYEAYKRQTWM
jgi:protein-S-isoprenylcysteine O-methyltransferase Ste14